MKEREPDANAQQVVRIMAHKGMSICNVPTTYSAIASI